MIVPWHPFQVLSRKIRSVSLPSGYFRAFLDIGVGKQSFPFTPVKWGVSGGSWEKTVDSLLCSQIMHSSGVKMTWNSGLKYSSLGKQA